MPGPAILTQTMDHGKQNAGNCGACSLPHNIMLELNLLLADPNQWPKTIFAGVKLPRGALPPGYRLWGAIRVGQQYLESQGITISERTLRGHYNRHVVQVPATAAHFAEQGMLAASDTRSPMAPDPVVEFTPDTYRQFYAKGVALGQRGLELLHERIDEAIADGEKPSLELLLKAADIGTKLATSAATLQARNNELTRQQEDEIEGFRAGSMPLPSDRMGHHRIRVVEGEARPITDEGRADRREHNKRAKEEGTPTLPA